MVAHDDGSGRFEFGECIPKECGVGYEEGVGIDVDGFLDALWKDFMNEEFH